MQLNIDIEGLVAASLEEALSAEKLRPIIDASVERSVKSAIEEQFSYRSPFKKLLESSLEAAMPTDIGQVGRYGDLVLKRVQAVVTESQNNFVSQTVEEKLREMLKPIPAEMKLSELVNRLTNHFADSYRREGDERPTFHIERSDVSDGYFDLYADPSEEKSKYSCAIHMRFNKEGKCWALQIDESENPAKRIFIGPCYGADALALNLYTGGTRVLFEHVDTDDIYYESRCDD